MRRQGSQVSMRVPAEGEGYEGFTPPPDKDLESPSSTRLEALVPSRDSIDNLARYSILRNSLVAQMVKNPPAMQEIRFDP